MSLALLCLVLLAYVSLAGVQAHTEGGPVLAITATPSMPSLYLPLLAKPAATPTSTATATPTGTATATVTTTATATSTPTSTATTPPAPAPDCAAEYPTVCIPPPPPDLNCGDISFRRFTVLPPDRHNFDTDHDGIGCESG